MLIFKTRLVKLKYKIDQYLSQMRIGLVFQPDNLVFFVKFSQEIIKLFHVVKKLFTSD